MFDNLPTPLDAMSWPLTCETVKKLKTYFESVDHHPSRDMWTALTDLARTMEAMATGTAPQKFHLSSLDPGVGKTQTLVKFVDTMLSRPVLYSNVGVIICVGRLAEIEKLVEEMFVPPEMLFVYTADPKVNALGSCPTADTAQVMITTQQMVERRLSAREVPSFEAVSDFHYRGQPRQVRVWDETWLPGETITINRDELADLFRPMRAAFPILTDEIEDFFTDIRRVEDGTVVEVPNFMENYDGRLDLNNIIKLFDNPRNEADERLKDHLREAASALWFLSGRTCTVRRDDNLGNTLLDYDNSMPIDLAPMLIMDASGRVRRTYHDVEKHRGNLVRLGTATKNYEPLKVHIWQRGGGKSAFQRHGDKLADGIAETILTKPDEPWLVVIHQQGGKVGDVEKTIRERLGPFNQDTVHFLTWGQHMATNEFATVPNVILAGTLFYRTSHYEALKRLAVDRRASDGPVTKHERREIMNGENQHLILQAACRGRVRKCVNDQCAPCDLYIIASVRSGIPSAIKDIFPGCSVDRWSPIKIEPRGKVKEALDFIKDAFDKEPARRFLRFSDIQKAVSVDGRNFKNDVRRHSDYVDTIADLGLVEAPTKPGGKNYTGLLKFHEIM